MIHAGSGGVGSLAIQLAKSRGAYVITTTSGKNVALVKSLGADEVIDHNTQKFAEILHDVDVVFDTLGGVFEDRLYLLSQVRLFLNNWQCWLMSESFTQLSARNLH